MFSTMERLTDICTLSAFVYLMLATLFKICPCGYGNLSYSMMEEVPINTFIADLKTCIKTNTTEESVFGFLTTDQRYEELFHIADDTGLLFTSKTIDREIICLHRATCVLELQVYVNGTKNGFIQKCNISVKIDDINDNSPVFPVPSISIYIPENDAIGKSVNISDYRADDRDYGLLGVQTYSIPSNTSPLPFSVSFNGNSTLLLILNRPIDREYVALYNFLIVATDGGLPPRSASLSVSTIVTDVNDNKPLFPVPSYHVNISKYQPVNSTILHLSAVDHDAGVNGEVHYTLNPSQNIDILKSFYIDEAGDLLLTTPLIDKTQEGYTISVIALDLGQPPLTTLINIYVDIMTPNITVGDVSVTNYDNTTTDTVITGLDNTTFVEEEPASNDDPGSFKWYIAVIVVVIVLILSIIGICIFWKRRRKSFYAMRKNCDDVRKTSSDAKRNTTEYDEIDYNNMQSDNAQKSGGATDHGRQLVQQQFTGSEGIAGTEYTEMNIIGAADMQEYTHMYQPLTDNRQSDSHKYSSVNQKAQPSDIGIVNLQCVEASNETSNTNELTYEKQAENIQANNRHTLNLWRELYANLPDNSRNSLTEASKKDVKKGKKGLKKIN